MGGNLWGKKLAKLTDEGFENWRIIEWWLIEEKIHMQLKRWMALKQQPGQFFLRLAVFFSKVAGNSADTAVVLLRTVIVEILLRIVVDRRYFLTKIRYFHRYPTKKRRQNFLILMQKKA